MVNAVEFLQNVQLACLAVVFTCMALGNRSDRVLRLVWYSFLVLGIGGVIDLAAAHLPSWIGYGLNFTVAPVSYGLLNLAIATFVGRELWTRWISVALVLGSVPFYLYWSSSPTREINSVAVIDFVMFLQTACTAWILLQSRERSTRLPRYIMCIFFSVFALDGLYRAAVVALLRVTPEQFMPLSGHISASVYIVAVSLLPLNIIWMMNARMREKMKIESNIDPLTELLNRRGFAEIAERELARYVRGRQNFVVAVADIDHFKRLNDEHGHACGDLVLRFISNQFRDFLRFTDIISRCGGEEFVFLLPMTSDVEAFRVLDRLRATLEQQTIHIKDGVDVKATISFGITNTAGRTELTCGGLQHEADQALYAAKHAGRNRTVRFHELSKPAVQGTPSDSAYSSSGAIPASS